MVAMVVCFHELSTTGFVDSHSLGAAMERYGGGVNAVLNNEVVMIRRP